MAKVTSVVYKFTLYKDNSITIPIGITAYYYNPEHASAMIMQAEKIIKNIQSKMSRCGKCDCIFKMDYSLTSSGNSRKQYVTPILHYGKLVMGYVSNFYMCENGEMSTGLLKFETVNVPINVALSNDYYLTCKGKY